VNQTIKDAISGRKLLRFEYDGHSRVVEPYCLGYTDNSNLALRAYQTKGSGKTKVPDWKLFKLQKIRNLESENEKFNGVRDGYSPNDKDLSPILMDLK
jgi:predicted DNA-binding transcriptional regulator YafY